MRFSKPTLVFFIFATCSPTWVVAGSLKYKFQEAYSSDSQTGQKLTSGIEGLTGLGLAIYGYDGARKMGAYFSRVLGQNWTTTTQVYEPLVNALKEYQVAMQRLRDVQKPDAPHREVLIESRKELAAQAKAKLEHALEHAIEVDPGLAPLRSSIRTGDVIEVATFKPMQKAVGAVERARSLGEGLTLPNILSRAAGVLLMVDAGYRMRLINEERRPGMFPLATAAFTEDDGDSD